LSRLAFFMLGASLIALTAMLHLVRPNAAAEHIPGATL
jgi:hypothetical protein